MSLANNDDSVIQWQLMLCCGFGKNLEQEGDFGKYGWALVNNEIELRLADRENIGSSDVSKRKATTLLPLALTHNNRFNGQGKRCARPGGRERRDLTAWDRGAAHCGRKGGAPSGNSVPASVRGMGEMMGTTQPVSHGLDTRTGTFLIDLGGRGADDSLRRLKGCGRANYFPPPTSALHKVIKSGEGRWVGGSRWLLSWTPHGSGAPFPFRQAVLRSRGPP